jgi:hypothetical protein
MKIRKFTPAGIEAYGQFITASKANFSAGMMMPPVPDTLLLSDLHTAVTEYDLPDIPKSFDSKWELGKFIANCIPESRFEHARTDGPMFSWLSALLFDQTTKVRSEELREERAYIANTGYQHFYRHLILGPYFFYSISRDNPERSRILLYSAPDEVSEMLAQFGANRLLYSNRSLQEVLYRLYYDPKAKKMKKGAGNKTGGASRRFTAYLNQIGINFDLSSITSDQFIAMLPPEFDKFKLVVKS